MTEHEHRAGCASEAEVVDVAARFHARAWLARPGNTTHAMNEAITAARALGCLMPDEAAALRAEADQITAGVREQIAQGAGFWKSCSGCHELNEGHPTGPYDSDFACELGMGCRECGGIGAIWDDTDYTDMAEFVAAQDTLEAERDALAARLKVAEEALRKIAASDGRGHYTTGEGHALCLELAEAALTPAAGDAP